MNHEGPFTGVTIDAVKRPSDTGRWPQWLLIEGGEARRINLCMLCYNAKLVQQSKQPLKFWDWKEVVEKKAHRRRLC